MRQLLLALLLCTSFVGFGQCPTTPIVLSSQADVDNFATTYPNCTALLNNLTISGSDITDLSTLPDLTIGSYEAFIVVMNNSNLINLNGWSIDLNNPVLVAENYLIIRDNPVLSDISGLNSIPSTSGSLGYVTVNLINNPLLNSLNGLEFLTNSYILIITNNDSLTDLSGLENLTNVGSLYIRENDGLINFTGLSSVNIFEELFVQNNTSLQNFDGINPNMNFSSDLRIQNNLVLNDILALNDIITDEFFYLRIEGNTNLSLCNIDSFCSSISNYSAFDYENSFNVEGNNTNCTSKAEVLLACSIIPINDNCDNAFSLTLGETLQAYNQLATTSTETPSCNDTDRADVWFTFNSGTNATIDILVDANYNIQLWQGSCGSLTQIAGSCSTGSLQDFPVTTNTDYYVQVWSCESCRLATGLFTIQIQDGTLSTTEVSINNDIKLFPNPVKNTLTINANKIISNVVIYSIYGQRVFESKPNTLESIFDFEALKSGIYLIKVESDGQEQTFKVVKE